MSISVSRVFNFLRRLPTITFVFMLGSGFVITAFAAWYTVLIGHGKWPESVAADRIHSLTLGMVISLCLIGVLIVFLAFGKVDKLRLEGSVVSGEIDFEGDGVTTTATATSTTTVELETNPTTVAAE